MLRFCGKKLGEVSYYLADYIRIDVINMKTIKQSLTSFKEKMQEKVLFAIKAYGLGFLITVILSDLLDEVIIPGVLLYFGHPVLSVTAIVGDIDWITYPLYFVVANKLKRGVLQ